MILKRLYQFIAVCFKNVCKFIWAKFLCNIFKTGCQSKTVFKGDQHSRNLQPVPVIKGLPLVGTFFDLIAAGGAPKLHMYIDKRHAECGHIFRERLAGSQDCIFVSSASLMRSMFMQEGSHPRHPLPESWLLYNKENNCQRGLFFMDGKEWFHNRRILNRLLLNGNLDWMNWHVREQTNKLIQNWLHMTEEDEVNTFLITNLEEQLYRWSIDVIISVMFGETSELDLLHIQIAVDEFSKTVHKIFESSSPLMNFPAKLAKLLSLHIWVEFENSVHEVLSKGYYVIDLFLERTSAYPGGLYAKLQEAEVPIEMIKRIFVDLVIAAGDTTAYSTTWALYLLSRDDKLQEKLYGEYNSSSHDTPLVRGLVKEALRLYPVAPFIGRYMPQDCVLDKYYIEKNSLIFSSLFTAGRDPQHFPDPLTVMPERWLRNEHTGKLNAVNEAHATLPFAIGNRSCIGRKLALNQMHYIIAEMTKHFKLKCLNSSTVESVLRLVTVPMEPINILLSKRCN